MKLNLLPTHVSKESQSKYAWVATIGMSVAALAAGIFAVGYSSTALTNAKARVADAQPHYDAAVATAKKADDIMASSVVIDRNVRLSKAMMDHNTVYPNLYREVLGYIPSFFRINSISAVPQNEKTCTVTMVGVLQTYQQYADIMLALLRIPGASNVTRTGFTDIRRTVPSLNENDQIGLPVKPGEANLPSDPMKRLDEMIARAGSAPQGYQNIGGFGTNAAQKGAMPDWSQVTVTVTMDRNLMTPVPLATLKAQGGAGAGTPSAGNKPNSAGFTPGAGSRSVGSQD